jgi:hypothetical protein
MSFILTDPRIFNFILIGLYALNIGRWLIHGNPLAALYWFGAFVITIAVTWGAQR